MTLKPTDLSPGGERRGRRLAGAPAKVFRPGPFLVLHAEPHGSQFEVMEKRGRKIDNARTLLLNAEADSLKNEKIEKAWTLSMASVNPSNGEISPIIFRPPAFLPCTLALVITSAVLNRRHYETFLSQSMLHLYVIGFGMTNGNIVKKECEQKTEERKDIFPSGLSLIASVAYASVIGSVPQFYLNRYKPRSPSFQFIMRNLVPGPLTGALCALSLLVMRSKEIEDGIEVMDSKGNIIGVSQKAGEKAVDETALSRLALFGTGILVSDLALHVLKRRSIFLEKSFPFICMRWSITLLALGTMIPISFSWMPQLGKIQRNELEPEIMSSTEESELFYYRGI
ncbi:hypothetical protein JRQ81_018280 [Phrynocephalus forsythii]|uniref:Sideroflexin-4 n=1 Tax=Phrynocephalus forsythii TaxID=171643 RepID=A0A9Q0XRY2_9SAUR|nr:hypothetical protein JRQ81_018280 [Phrynocephalus forsythii]